MQSNFFGYYYIVIVFFYIVVVVLNAPGNCTSLGFCIPGSKMYHVSLCGDE